MQEKAFVWLEKVLAGQLAQSRLDVAVPFIEIKDPTVQFANAAHWGLLLEVAKVSGAHAAQARLEEDVPLAVM